MKNSKKTPTLPTKRSHVLIKIIYYDVFTNINNFSFYLKMFWILIINIPTPIPDEQKKRVITISSEKETSFLFQEINQKGNCIPNQLFICYFADH